MAKMKRIKVTDQIDRICFGRPLDDAISLLNTIKKVYGPQYEKIWLEEQYDCDCYGNCNGYNKEILVQGLRIENDEEYAARCKERKAYLKRLKENKKSDEQKERELYDKLKAKFGA